MMLLRLSQEGRHPAAMGLVHSMLPASHQWLKHVLRPGVGLVAVPASVLHTLHFIGTAYFNCCVCGRHSFYRKLKSSMLHSSLG